MRKEPDNQNRRSASSGGTLALGIVFGVLALILPFALPSDSKGGLIQFALQGIFLLLFLGLVVGWRKNKGNR